MPVSVVVGGQFGSEGKGKIALEIVRRDRSCTAVIRVGGTNSGHTAIGKDGRTHVLRQIPAAAIDRNVQVILPPGAYIDPEIFVSELDQLGLDRKSVLVSPMARVITDEHKQWEALSGLGPGIGSTQSGTGAAVLASVARTANGLALHSLLAEEVSTLQPFLHDTSAVLRRHLSDGCRVVIEGTQGFGLSLLHGGFWPKATSRDTSAAGFVAEAGVSPLDVDDVTMVLRCHPIRVAGESGPLVGETTWPEVASESGMPADQREYTTVTRRLRRIGHFDVPQVLQALAVNAPTRVALNHLDYVDWNVRGGVMTDKASGFVSQIEAALGRKIDWLGIGPDRTIDRHQSAAREMYRW